MNIIATEIAGLLVVQLEIHRDQRGFFAETWREEWGEQLELERPFVQDNLSRSSEKGVLRGLHFQAPPAAQAKLVWVSRGAVYDVAVDLRRSSPTYGRWHALVLSEENMLRFFVPEGFAHGYMTLEPESEFNYKVNSYYSPGREGGIAFDDAEIGVTWPGVAPVMAERDRRFPRLKDFLSPFA
ncbi:MAG: dTDP-4-dehydrorhamnose 3,5-epimerase [Desulfovibrio sp.]|jgi:dTDP-4-dehydrorhamnose 3,5-epimerase|nr:dTDP-4-dehydrorhamnose 3,5-epimerase [Desulfovibrio sp.]